MIRRVRRGYQGRIGIASIDISPPVGIRMRNWGAQTHEVSTGNASGLAATVVTFQTTADDPPLIWAGIDCGWWRDPADELRVRAPLINLAGDESRVIVGLSHTHAGPSLWSADGPDMVRYLEVLARRLRLAGEEALATAQPCRIEWFTLDPQLAFDRNLAMDGEVVVAANPDAPVSAAVHAGRITERQVTVGWIALVPLHPTMVGPANTRIHGDYIAGMRERLAPLLFGQGASGDLAGLLNYDARPDGAEATGRYLADSIRLASQRPGPAAIRWDGALHSGAKLGLWRAEGSEPSPALAAKVHRWTVPVRPPADPIPANDPSVRDPAMAERSARQAALARAIGSGPTTDLPVWDWQIGDLRVLTAPVEFYAGYQRMLPPGVVIQNVGNGWLGYLPTPAGYAADNYATRQTPFPAEAAEIVTQKFKELLQS